jgi:hypothetical protein
MQEKPSADFTISLSELANKIALLLPEFRTEQRIQSIGRIASTLATVFTIENKKQIILL